MPLAFGGVTPTVTTMPTVSVQLSFTPPFTTRAWVDVTPYVRAGQIHFGRQHELQQVVPSVLTLTLANQDARFLPWNTAGPYAAMGAGLVPEVSVRVLATWGSITYPVYDGYVDSWYPAFGPAGPDVTVTASDILSLLAIADLTSSAFSTQVLSLNPSGYWRFGDLSGTVASDASPNARNGTYLGQVGLAVPGALALDTDTGADLGGGGNGSVVGNGAQATVQVPTAACPIGNSPWTYAIGLKLNSAAPLPSAASALFFSIDIGARIVQFSFDQSTISVFAGPAGSPQVLLHAPHSIPFDGAWHRAVFTWDGSTSTIWLDGARLAYTAAAPLALTAPSLSAWGANIGGQPTLDAQVDEASIHPAAWTPAQVATDWALFDAGYAVQHSGERISAVLADVGIPAAYYNIATGVSLIQGVTSSLTGSKVLSYLQTVNNTEAGLLFASADGVITFLDRYATLNTGAPGTVSGIAGSFYARPGNLRPGAMPGGVGATAATFEDAGSSSYYYLADQFAPGVDNLDLWNDVSVSAQAGTGAPKQPGGSVQRYTNAASKARYGTRSYPSLTGLLMTSDQAALGLAQWLGGRYSTPLTRVRSITMDSQTNGGGNLPQMLGRKLWDKITVISHGLVGGTALQQDSLIEGGSHTFSPDRWVTTFHLSPADPNRYFRLDDPTYSQLDQTSFGLAY